jgi:hypothetical protein
VTIITDTCIALDVQFPSLSMLTLYLRSRVSPSSRGTAFQTRRISYNLPQWATAGIPT